QGSRLFYEAFAEHLLSMGWEPSTADKCLFLKPDLPNAAVVIWVDDFIFMCDDEAVWLSFIEQLRKRFTVPAVGDLVSFLGMNIVYNAKARTTYFASQLYLQPARSKLGAMRSDCQDKNTN